MLGSLSAQYRLDPNKKLDQYNYDHWDSHQGLPDNAIIHITQSKDGYIWFASYGGITKFNGVDFITYSTFNTQEITNNSFTYIYEDKDQVIWTATSGNGITTIENGQLKNYTVADGLPSNFIEEIVQDQEGRIWIATSDGLTEKTDSGFSTIGIPKILHNLRLKSLAVDSYNNVWIGTTDQGVYQMKNGQILNYYHEGNGLASNNINYIKAEGGDLWIGSSDGLSIISKGKIKNIEPDQGLPNNMISTFLVDNNNQAWIGSFKGLARYDSAQGWSYFPQEHPFYENDFTSMIQDYEGNIWVGTYRQGLYKLWDGKFTNYSRSVVNDVTPYIVHCIIKNDENNLLVLHELGVDKLNPEQNKLEKYYEGFDFSDTKLKFGLKDSRGYLWVATQDYLVRYKDGQIKKITEKEGLVNNSVRVLYEDSEGNIWAGTTNGISIIEPGGDIRNISVKNGLSHEYIMNIMGDSKGNIWIGTRNGLNIYKDGRFITFYKKDGLAGDFVFKTFEDSEGTIWVCGNAGLTRFKDGEFKIITSQNGLASNTLFQMLEDEMGYFWFTTNQKNISVFKVHKSQLNDFADGKIDKVSSIGYTQADGIKGTSATSSAMSYKSDDGKLWLATIAGVESIDPTNIENNMKEPPVMIESIADNTTSYNISQPIAIPSDESRVNISFAALSYIASERIVYKYILEGFDEDWIGPVYKRETSYTNLPPGTYTFRVKAANSDGIWNDEGTAVTFKILPAYYQTWWFFTLSIIVGIAVIWLLYKIRVRALENAKIQLEQQVETRTKEIVAQKEEIEKQKIEIEGQQEQIELKNKELQKININLEDIVEERTEELKKAYNDLVEVSNELDTFIYRSVHDVRGPLARLQGLSHLISLETKDKDIQDLIERLNHTADEMNEVFYSLLNIARLKATTLNYEKVELDRIIKSIINRLNFQKNKFHFDINIEPGVELECDTDILEVIFYQLIENAIKFKTGDIAHIKIECKPLDFNTVKIKISDRGIGISEKVADKVFDMFYVGHDEVKGAGLGLYTVRTAVKVLQGTINLTENAIRDEFTTFEITLPKSKIIPEKNTVKI